MQPRQRKNAQLFQLRCGRPENRTTPNGFMHNQQWGEEEWKLDELEFWLLVMWSEHFVAWVNASQLNENVFVYFFCKEWHSGLRPAEGLRFIKPRSFHSLLFCLLYISYYITSVPKPKLIWFKMIWYLSLSVIMLLTYTCYSSSIWND